jgi:archaellum component FlaC
MKDESKPQQVTNVVIRAENQLGKVNDFIDNSKDGLEKLRLTSD